MTTETDTENLSLIPYASHGATRSYDEPPWRVDEADAVSIVSHILRVVVPLPAS